MAKKTPLMVTRKMIDNRIVERVEMEHDNLPSITPDTDNIGIYELVDNSFTFIDHRYTTIPNFFKLFNFSCKENKNTKIELYYRKDMERSGSSTHYTGGIYLTIDFVPYNFGSSSLPFPFQIYNSNVKLFNAAGSLFPSDSNIYMIEKYENFDDEYRNYFFAIGYNTGYVSGSTVGEKGYINLYNYDILG